MPSSWNKSITLFELIIALVLFSLIVIGIGSISVFGRFHVLTSDRRAKVQNEISYCFDHISKFGSRAIGNEAVFGANSAVRIVAGTSVAFFIDANKDGLRNTVNDYWIRYSFASNSLTYCGNCGNDSASASCNVPTEVLSSKITSFTPTKNFAAGNHIRISITGCYNPAGVPFACNHPNNPSVVMESTISLPSVSTF